LLITCYPMEMEVIEVAVNRVCIVSRDILMGREGSVTDEGEGYDRECEEGFHRLFLRLRLRFEKSSGRLILALDSSLFRSCLSLVSRRIHAVI